MAHRTGTCPSGLTHEEAFHWHMGYNPPAEGCWVWTGKPDERGGYGQLHIRGQKVRVHALSYRIHHGELPKGQVVRHLCNNPICVHPQHLAPGTVWDNSQDSIAAGTNAFGERNAHAKLTDESVIAIRKAVLLGESQASVSRRYGVAPRTVSDAVARKTWKHLAR